MKESSDDREARARVHTHTHTLCALRTRHPHHQPTHPPYPALSVLMETPTDRLGEQRRRSVRERGMEGEKGMEVGGGSKEGRVWQTGRRGKLPLFLSSSPFFFSLCAHICTQAGLMSRRNACIIPTTPQLHLLPLPYSEACRRMFMQTPTLCICLS